jgi:hypothetical protein
LTCCSPNFPDEGCGTYSLKGGFNSQYILTLPSPKERVTATSPNPLQRRGLTAECKSHWPPLIKGVTAAGGIMYFIKIIFDSYIFL